MKPRINVIEILGYIGILLGMTGALKPFTTILNKPDVDQFLTAFGVAIFFTSVLFEIQSIRRRLDGIEQTTHFTEAARRIFEKQNVNKSTAEGPFLNAVIQAFVFVMIEYLPKAAKSLEYISNGQSFSITVDEHSPIVDLLNRLAANLPRKGVWYGISLLESESAWKGPEEDQFSKYTQLMRARAGKDITVLRLYYFKNENVFKEMRKVLDEEHKANISIRYIIGGSPPPDISLLWAAPPFVRGLAKVNSNTNQPVAAVIRYSPVCAIKFDVKPGGHSLSSLTSYSGSSEEFGRLSSVFENFWIKATPFIIDKS